MIFKPSDKERLSIYIDKQFEKKKFLDVKPVKELKTLSQNNYLWLVFTHISFQTRNNKDDIYLYYLEKFPKFKEIEFNGEIELVRISLSGFTKEQTMVFIDEVTTDARQEGFEVPDPEDLQTLNMFNYYNEKGMI